MEKEREKSKRHSKKEKTIAKQHQDNGNNKSEFMMEQKTDNMSKIGLFFAIFIHFF